MRKGGGLTVGGKGEGERSGKKGRVNGRENGEGLGVGKMGRVKGGKRVEGKG